MSMVFAGAVGSVRNKLHARALSLSHVRTRAFSAFSLAVETAVTATVRALDKANVLFVINPIEFLVNVTLDLLLSSFHVSTAQPFGRHAGCVQALEATALAFKGGPVRGQWRQQLVCISGGALISSADLMRIVRRALMYWHWSLLLRFHQFFVFALRHLTICFGMSVSADVVAVRAYMWRSSDWCYIFFAASTQLA
ncbi:hypothetical protein G7054_g6519 [Neopestalotiopsis clavispora]|nr:hypothetical protein G7054_g6519 [Neopestalotiopsis clavispora]